MKYTKYIISAFIGILVLASISTSSASTLQGYQGGTGISTSSPSDVGKVLTVSSSTPYLTYTLSVATGGFTTSTLAGLQDIVWQLSSGNSLLSITTSTLPSTITLTVTSTPIFSSTTISNDLNVGQYAQFGSSTTAASDPIDSNHVRLFGSQTAGGVTRLAVKSSVGTFAIFRDSLYRVANNTGSDILKGSAVYVNGSDGTNPTVALAKADTISTAGVFGVMLTNASSSGFGTVQLTGTASGLDTSAFSVGDVLYLSSSTAGLLTKTAPSAPSILLKVGVVDVVSATNGSITLDIQKAVPSTLPAGGVTYYMRVATSSDITADKQATQSIPTEAEATLTATTSASIGKKLIKTFITEPGDPNLTSIPAGEWDPHIYASVDVSGGSTYVIADVYKITTSSVETLLLSSTSTLIGTSITDSLMSVATSTVTLNASDRLEFKFSAYSTSAGTRTVTFYYADGTHSSNVLTPILAPLGVELTQNKNTPNGYAGLDSSGKLFTSQLPSSVITTSSISSYALVGATSTNNLLSVASSSGVLSLTPTTTPSFTSVTYPDSTKQTTAYKDLAFNVYNTSSTTAVGASSTVQKIFYKAMTLTQVDCSTDGSSITIQADIRSSSTPQTYGTSSFSGLVCLSTGASTTTFSNANISAGQVLNFWPSSVPNSTTTLRVNMRLKEQ